MLRLPSEAFTFGEDEYIRVLALIGEGYINIKRYDLAVDKLEQAKKKALQEVVYDKPY
jgi:hypothetical protein